MPEITSLADAQYRVNALFKAKSEAPAGLLDDYARIAWFLSNPSAPNFPTAMTNVSAALWDVYRDLYERHGAFRRNLFTSAIREVAGRMEWQYGSEENVVLVYAVTAADYMNWVRQGIFFKDMMDVKHGEHSHTFQWLAVAFERNNIGLVHAPCYLYKNTDKIMRKNKAELILPKEKHPSGSQATGTTFDLWAWVLDCFPVSMAKAGVDPGGESIFSNSFRTPQKVTEYLLDNTPNDHFVGSYLKYRYQRRAWFEPDGSSYAQVSGSSSKDRALQTHQGVSDWKIVQGDKNDIGGFVRGNSPRFHTKEVAEKKKYINVRFHNKPGKLRDPSQVAG